MSESIQVSAPLRPPGPELFLTPDCRRFLGAASGCLEPVHLTGETGTGKTQLARLIHEVSPRGGRPFLKLQCSEVPETLAESEIFGHERGAFSGAAGRRIGLAETAQGGTLFLDDIECLSLPLQAKLLRLLDEKVIRRVGGTANIALDVRVITATNASLPELVARRTFRVDLVYRIAGPSFRLPALRERLRDLPRFVEAVLAQLEREWGPSRGAGGWMVTSDALGLLAQHSWPGNLRELRRVLGIAAGSARAETIGFGEVEAALAPFRRLAEELAGGSALPPSSGTDRYRNLLDPRHERERILAALRTEGGHRVRTARRLGMSRQTLWMKIREHEIRSVDFIDGRVTERA